MKGYIVRKFGVLGLTIAAAMAPAAALAQQTGGYYFNDGNGNCGYVECGSNGCVVIERWACPREMGDD